MIIGLTGGIASGKNESVKYIKTLIDVYTIDADVISHELTKKGTTGFINILKIFGKNILTSEGFLNRKKLSNIFFSNKVIKTNIEKILHNSIVSIIYDLIFFRKKIVKNCNIVINAPLLFEVGLHKVCDKVISIYVSREVQIKRLLLRDKLNCEQINNRISSQMPCDERTKLADFILDNVGTKTELQFNIRKILRSMFGGI
ncbi:MAG: dephospho-CoA kinase [Endomicrobium sp.]|jgi:dephospho-CoA kinase|nr:dephospho-CoA kinase [Endomicrobium sp.]